MFGNLGLSETLVLFVIALIVLGPRRLPRLASNLGRMVAQFRRQATEIRQTVEREVEGTELAGTLREIQQVPARLANLRREIVEPLTSLEERPGEAAPVPDSARGVEPTREPAAAPPAATAGQEGAGPTGSAPDPEPPAASDPGAAGASGTTSPAPGPGGDS